METKSFLLNLIFHSLTFLKRKNPESILIKDSPNSKIFYIDGLTIFILITVILLLIKNFFV